MFAARSHRNSPTTTRISAPRELVAARIEAIPVNPFWQRLASGTALLPKLGTGDDDDALEREADCAADYVMDSSEVLANLAGARSSGSLPRSPSVQRKGIVGTIPEDVPRGMAGQFALNLPEYRGDIGKAEDENFWRQMGGVAGLITFVPSADKAVKNADKIGLVQIARVIDRETGDPLSLQARNPGVPAGTQTEEKKTAGIEAGFFLDQRFDLILRGRAPVSRFYIEQGTSLMLPGEQYGSKKRKHVTPAGLRDSPAWNRDCTYVFETYAQSDKEFVTYGGVRWGFTLTMKPDQEIGYDPKGNPVATRMVAEIEPLEIAPLYALSPTARDAVERFMEHMKAPEAEERDGEQTPQRKALDGQSVDGTPATSVLADFSAGSGQAPDEASRTLMEVRLGHDFSRVRVHDDRSAHEAAAILNARAFTWGSHVFFGAGQYQPGTSESNRLLAHELWHVVQQGYAARSVGAGANLTDPPAVSADPARGGIIRRQDAGSPTSATPPAGVTRDEEGRLRLDPELGPFSPVALTANQATPRHGSQYFPFWQARLMTQLEQQQAFKRALLRWARATYTADVYRAFENTLLYSLDSSLGSIWGLFQGTVDDAFVFNDTNFAGGSVEGGTYTVVSRIYVDINPTVSDPIHDDWDVKLIFGFKQVKVPPKVPWAGWAIRNGIGATARAPGTCTVDVTPGNVSAELVLVTTEAGRTVPELQWSDPQRLQELADGALKNPDPACLEFEGEVR